MNDVQISLDAAVDNYYSLLAQQSAFTFISGSETGDFNFSFSDTLLNASQMEVHTFTDSVVKNVNISGKKFSTFYQYETGSKSRDSVKITIDTLQFNRKPIEALTTKVMISFTQDSLSLNKIDSLFSEELNLKNIKINFDLLMKNNELSDEKQNSSANKLIAKASSIYIPKALNLTVEYNNITLQVLKKNLFGIFLSLVLLGSVIASLLYLFKIIRHQKKLSEIKSDLISNITHEFKTPIATISVAMEGLTGFNTEKPDEKTRRYAQITTEQIKKLNLMVEKLLETATLDSEDLTLNKVEINLKKLIENCINNHHFKAPKTIEIDFPKEELFILADEFHLENAVNNVIDNAIKYGGDTIELSLRKVSNSFEILISDSGTSLTEEQKQLIFEKFYRVPKGNTHDVKGFGIGLYYTKKIIEKHNGSISVEITKKNTTFKIILPNE